MDSFIYKHEFWNYENEYRLISKQMKFIDFNKECLKKIEFGMNMSKEAMYSIIALCQKHNYTCNFEIYNIEKHVEGTYIYDQELIESMVDGRVLSIDNVGYKNNYTNQL